jgi:hypothetical protein
VELKKLHFRGFLVIEMSDILRRENKVHFSELAEDECAKPLLFY